MDIVHLGHAAFKLRGKTTTVVTDPYTDIGLKFPKHVEADIVTVSHDHTDHNGVGIIEGSPFVVSGPGEYEIKGVGIVGLSSYHDAEKGAKRGRNTIYRIDIEGVSIVHLGDLGHTLTTADVEHFDTVDILCMPVGGVYTIDAATAATIINEIEPSIVIPMHYHVPGLDEKMFADLAPLSVFLKEIGKEDVVPQSKLSITRDKLPETLQVVVLE